MSSAVDSLKTLSLAALPDLPDWVGKPNYSRNCLSAGILHFGPGNFHRAHQAVYLDALMTTGRDLDWAVIGASVMRNDEATRRTLLSQDLLGTVVAQSAQSSEVRVTGQMIDYLPVADTVAILAALTSAAIRIVSLTITEGGYFINADTRAFDVDDPAITHDAAHINAPITVFGLIVRALQVRREQGMAGFTVMSCDNLPHNGLKARAAVLGMARLVDASLADWINENVSFPSGMVDRISPATGVEQCHLIREVHGIADDVPVFCEDYIQWVLEDDFVAGRPALESVGVQFVDDVTPYETMKIRILNGGHALIAYPAALMDIEFADLAMADPVISGFLDKVERKEILPVVPAVPEIDLANYFSLIQSRFANPKVRDGIHRLCFDGSNRQPQFIVPTVRDRLRVGGSIEGLALASALWCRYCYGTTDSGVWIAPNDPNWKQLQQVAIAARQSPQAWLEMRDVYGDLGQELRFNAEFEQSLRSLWQNGTKFVLERYLRQPTN